MNKGACPECQWCYGNGCMQCDEAWKRIEERMMQPIFTADLNNPNDIELLKTVAHREVLEHAFGPDGGGIREIEERAAIASLIQAINKNREIVNSPDYVPPPPPPEPLTFESNDGRQRGLFG